MAGPNNDWQNGRVVHAMPHLQAPSPTALAELERALQQEREHSHALSLALQASKAPATHPEFPLPPRTPGL